MNPSGHRGGVPLQQGPPSNVRPPSGCTPQLGVRLAQDPTYPRPVEPLRQATSTQPAFATKPQMQTKGPPPSPRNPAQYIPQAPYPGSGTARPPLHNPGFGSDANAGRVAQAPQSVQDKTITGRQASQQDERSHLTSRPDHSNTRVRPTHAPASLGAHMHQPSAESVSAQAGAHHEPVPQARKGGRPMQAASQKFPINTVQPFRPNMAQPPAGGFGQPMTRSRDEQRPSQAYTDEAEGNEQEGEYLADENFQATENNLSVPTWDAQQAHDDNEQGSRYKLTTLYEPPLPEMRQTASQNTASRPNLVRQQVRGQGQQKYANLHSRPGQPVKSARVQSSHPLAPQFHQQLEAADASSPQTLKTAHSKFRPQAPTQSSPADRAHPPHQRADRMQADQLIDYEIVDDEEQAAPGKDFRMQDPQGRYRPVYASRLRQSTTGPSFPSFPSSTHGIHPNPEMDLQDFSNESTPNADDFDGQPGMELDADGNFLGQEEEELGDEQFTLAMDSATCPVKVEPITAREAPPNNPKGRQASTSSAVAVAMQAPPPPFKFANNFCSAEHLMKMVDVGVLQKKVLQQLATNEDKGWELRKEMVTTHADQSDLIQRQFYSYEMKLNEIKKLKDETLAEKKAITVKYEAAVAQAHDDMLGLTPGTAQYNKKRKLAKRAGSVGLKK